MITFSRLAILSRVQANRLAWGAILLATAIKVTLLLTSPLLLAGDEAHYWEWSRSLDISYYSKGPLVAWLIAVSTALFGDTAFAVRLPALLCGIAFFGLLYTFLRDRVRPGVAFAVLLLALVSPFFHAFGLGMNTDPPCMLLSLIAITQIYRALFEDRLLGWVIAGAAFGLAALAKFTVLIFPITILILVAASPRLRTRLANPYPWLGALFGACCLLPVLAWNMQHDWVNLGHNAGHVVSTKGFSLKPKYFFELLGGQLLFLGPVVALMLLMPLSLLFRLSEQRRHSMPDPVHFLLWLGTPLLLLCLSVSLLRPVYANWPLPAYVSLLLAAAFMMNTGWGYGVFQARAYQSAVVSCVAILAIVYPMLFGFTYGLNPKKLISKKLVGWDVIGSEIGAQLSKFPKSAQPFLTSDRYDELSAISFYTPGQPRGYQWVVGDRRMSQYDIWTSWPELKGRNALIITKDLSVPREYTDRFRLIEKVAGPIPVLLGGKPVREFFVFLGHSFDGERPGMARPY